MTCSELADLLEPLASGDVPMSAEVRAHIDGLQERFSANRIDYTVVNTSQPLDHALFSYLTTRERLTQLLTRMRHCHAR